MAIKRTELLIALSREGTDNERVGTTDAVSDELFLKYLNDAQERIYSQIVKTKNKLFTLETLISAVSGTESYSLADDTNLFQDIVSVEYSPDGDNDNYFALDKKTLKERLTTSGTPSFYIPRSSSFLANPIPDSASGKFRVNYNHRLPKLDKRRGVVSAVTLNGGAKTVTALTLVSSSLGFTLSQANFTRTDHLTIVGWDGVVKMKGIPIDSVHTGSGAVTVHSGFTYDTGETIAVNDYAVLGDYASSHSLLPDACEKFLLAYCDWKVFKKDSSADSAEAAQEVQIIESELVEAFSSLSSDVETIPILSTEYFF